ncbi:interferon-inducible GTPase 1-like [Mya arenaria]|uniref:interferon-inducible GTPase 1-like n=1 Tax=Mya arenaria TaxID=6604 RepID=UPI0022E7FE80|nr:interferon-inducible GTPase 1-like [Mya arenaria]
MATGSEQNKYADFKGSDNLTPGEIIIELDKKLNDWKNVPVNIAVVGITGTGKSAFVNAFLGLKHNDRRAANVGVVETTKYISRYPHPNTDKLIFWDVPGIGSEDFPAATYREKVKMKSYDFFVLMTARRFMENDVKLAQMIEAMGKKFFFVRSQVDVDIESEAKRTHLRTEDVEEKVLSKIREDSISRLKSLGMNDQTTFLIDNYSIDKYDYGELIEATQSGLDQMQQSAVAFSCTHLTSTYLIEKRAQDLYWRIPIVATKCGLVLLDSSRVEVMNDEIRLYRKQLGIDIEQKYLYEPGKIVTWLKGVVGHFSSKLQGQSIATIYTVFARFRNNKTYEQTKERLEKELNGLYNQAIENTRNMYTLTAAKGNP